MPQQAHRWAIDMYTGDTKEVLRRNVARTLMPRKAAEEYIRSLKQQYPENHFGVREVKRAK